MSTIDLGKRAKVSPTTIARFEAEMTKPVPATREVLRRAFEAAGVDFIGETGVDISRKPGNGKKPSGGASA